MFEHTKYTSTEYTIAIVWGLITDKALLPYTQVALQQQSTHTKNARCDFWRWYVCVGLNSIQLQHRDWASERGEVREKEREKTTSLKLLNNIFIFCTCHWRSLLYDFFIHRLSNFSYMETVFESATKLNKPLKRVWRSRKFPTPHRIWCKCCWTYLEASTRNANDSNGNMQ